MECRVAGSSTWHRQLLTPWERKNMTQHDTWKPQTQLNFLMAGTANMCRKEKGKNNQHSSLLWSDNKGGEILASHSNLLIFKLGKTDARKTATLWLKLLRRDHRNAVSSPHSLFFTCSLGFETSTLCSVFFLWQSWGCLCHVFQTSFCFSSMVQTIQYKN